MRPAKGFLAGLALFTALLLQVVIVNRLDIPYGRPNLVLIVLISVALTQGPMAGVVFGFGTGLMIDLLGAHVLGRGALVLCLLGYFAGLISPDSERTPLVPLASVFVGSAAATLLYIASGFVLGEGRVPVGTLAGFVTGVAGYDLLLTPFVYPALRGAFRRLEPERRL